VNLTKGVMNGIILQPIYRKCDEPASNVKELVVDLTLKNYREAVLFNDKRNLLPKLTHRFSEKAQNLNNN